jgi:hypothetical protein
LRAWILGFGVVEGAEVVLCKIHTEECMGDALI